jgi:hypothetical protein
MLTNLRIFWVLAGFFLASAITYIVWHIAVEGEPEWAGTVAMLLSAALAAFIAFYLTMAHRAQGGELPEDRLDADIDDGDSELGHFSPWSWWPIVLAGALALTFLGLAVGTWLSFIGVPLVIVGLVGWVFEYYRGNFAR